jgi:hypothetical protein
VPPAFVQVNPGNKNIPGGGVTVSDHFADIAVAC